MDTAKIRMRCPVCGKKLTASREKLGKLARCPHCSDTIRIVSMPEQAPAAAAPAAEAAAPQTPATEAPQAQAPHGQAPPGQAPHGQAPHGRAPQAQAPEADEPADDVDDGPEARPVEHEAPMAAGALASLAPIRRAPPVVHAEEEETSLHDPGEDFGPVDVPVASGGGPMRIAVILGFPVLLVIGLLGGYLLGGLGDGKPPGNGGNEDQPGPIGSNLDERQRQEDERAYLRSVQVVRFEVGRTDLREHALLGEVRNEGDEALEQVKIVVRSSNGDTPIEQELWVVDASASRVGHQAHPLQPGQTREFVMDLQDMSAAWGGEVQVEVTEVRFHRPDASGTGG